MSLKKCRTCGREVGDWKFCKFCGTPLDVLNLTYQNTHSLLRQNVVFHNEILNTDDTPAAAPSKSINTDTPPTRAEIPIDAQQTAKPQATNIPPANDFSDIFSHSDFLTDFSETVPNEENDEITASPKAEADATNEPFVSDTTKTEDYFEKNPAGEYETTESENDALEAAPPDDSVPLDLGNLFQLDPQENDAAETHKKAEQTQQCEIPCEKVSAGSFSILNEPQNNHITSAAAVETEIRKKTEPSDLSEKHEEEFSPVDFEISDSAMDNDFNSADSADTNESLDRFENIPPINDLSSEKNITSVQEEIPFEPTAAVREEVPFEPAAVVQEEVPFEPVAVVQEEVPFEPADAVQEVVPFEPVAAVQEEVPVEPVAVVQEEVPFEPAAVVQEEVPFEPVAVVQEEVPFEPADAVQEVVPFEPIAAVQEEVPVEPVAAVQEEVPFEPAAPVAPKAEQAIPLSYIDPMFGAAPSFDIESIKSSCRVSSECEKKKPKKGLFNRWSKKT